MEKKKDNSVLIRLSDDEVKQLNDGWYKAVALAGRPVTKSEYLRACISHMDKFLKDAEKITGLDLSFLDPNKYDYLNVEE